MPRRVALAASLALTLALMGCMTSRKLTTRDEFAHLAANQKITIYAREDREYRLYWYALKDSVFHGSGTLKQRGTSTHFEGAIPFSEIIAVKTKSPNLVRGPVALGITILFVGYLIAGTGSDDGLSVIEDFVYRYPSGGGGTSCPYIYAWDGARYELQAEPFGVAWGKALELTTLHLLPAARAENGVVRLRLTNEREETHYVNSIQLRAIELGTAPAAVLDGEGRAWPLSHPQAPIAARDESGHDILPQLASSDSRMWECDPSSLTAGSGYEDVLEVAFARPRQHSTGSLVISGINTALSTSIYGHLCQMVGDQVALLAHAVETDPELIEQLREYLRDASLKAFVWNGIDWEPAGAIQPEASAVTFSRALRIRIPEAAGDTVRLQLRSMADVWKLDAIAAEWGDAPPLPMSPVKLLSAIGSSGEDLRGVIASDDRDYAILLPPDRVDLTFEVPRTTAGARVVYAVAGRGYLLEWDRPVADGPVTTLASYVPEEGRIEFLKELLKHRELALQPVYDAWRKVRSQ